MSAEDSPQKPARRLRIIHLEDDLHDYEMLLSLLAEEGIDCEIVRVDHRDSFQRALEADDVDLIVSDFSLPSYDGSRALAMARKLRPETPFIFFSGTLGEEAAVESLKSGATDYVLKQRPRRLLVAARRALADASARAEARRMHEELRRRDGLLRSIVENIEDLVTVADLEGRIAWCSPSYERLLGAEGPVVGSDVFLHTHPEDLERTRRAFAHTATTGAPQRLEYRICLPGEGVRLIETQSSVIRDEDGNQQSVLWVSRDLTRRRLAEEQIREQAALLDVARDAICVTDLHQRILFWNRSAAQLYGWSRQEAMGCNANLLLGDESAAISAFKTLMQRAEWHGELRQRTRSGGTLVVESRWTLIRDAAGAPKSILVINSDITQRKQTERKIRRQAALLDQARDAILVCDHERRIVYWNEGATRIYGWPAEEALGQAVETLLFAEEPFDWPLIRQTVTENGEWVGELRQTTKSGREAVVLSRQTLVGDVEKGEDATAVLFINTDITEQKKIESQFLRTQRMESIGDLAGGISHDLNNVLGPIMMAVEVIQSEPEGDNADLLDVIATSARRGSDLVKQLLSFARGADGEKVALSVHKVVSEVVKLAAETFDRSITVCSRVAEDLPMILGDATQLHQVLLNLCVNARDAMPQGGEILVEVGVATLEHHVTPLQPLPVSGRFVELKVSDTGQGIEADVLPRIFEPFFTTKPAGKGTGLGLSTVVAIARGHGGFVEVRSVRGQGATFSVFIPALIAPAATPRAAEMSKPPRGRNERILIVDDESAILEITRTTLIAFNYHAQIVKGGVDALAVFTQNAGEYDLVITDMMMPSIDGKALIQALRKIRPDVCILAVSGFPLERYGGLPSGASSFLRKPYTAATLLTEIRKVLDR